MSHPTWSVRDLFAMAYLDGLNRMARAADVQPVSELSRYVRIDDPARPAHVRLEAPGGDR